MEPFRYRDAILHAELCSVQEIAEAFGTPCYVYSTESIRHQFALFQDALGAKPHQICYAVKANSNGSLLRLLVSLGSGFDIVSIGELKRVMQAGANPAHVVFSGVGKQHQELAQALKFQIGCFNVESEEELLELHQLAEHLQIKAPIALRVNPDISVQSHPYIATGLHSSKFGIPFSQAYALYKRAAQLPYFEIKGVACHIGSQITELGPFSEAASRMNEFVVTLGQEGITLSHIDMGGGLGIDYQNENPPTPSEMIQALRSGLKDCAQPLWIEPGRALIAKAGILVTQVIRIKKNESKYFCITDAGMNDLIRPALYQAVHTIKPVIQKEGPQQVYDVVGPLCETGDILGSSRALLVHAKDFLAIADCGAYGFSMSSNYNSRPRGAEVLVSGVEARLIRQRETQEDLWALESSTSQRA